MTAPRAIFPGRTYFITRRCTQRQFLLKPDEVTNGVFLYCLAEAAKRYGIEIIAVCAQSNHYHAIVHDPDGRLPAFLAHFHKLVAKAMNCRWGRWENLWAAEPCCEVTLESNADLFDKMIYTLTNGVKDHLVDRVVHWPGASSFGAQLRDKPLVIERPRIFFDPNGRMPETVQLSFVRPRGFAHLSHEAWCEKILDAVAKVEAEAAEERRKKGTKVLGRKKVLTQEHFEHPNSPEPRRNLRPRIAARSKWHRIDAIRRDKLFQRRYREAYAELHAGNRDAIFPAGTYQLRVRGLVQCEPPPAPS